MLDRSDLAVSRVAERVKMGGHFVPEATIRRRFESGRKNFFKLYKPLADSWQMYDNTLMGNLAPIASMINSVIDIQAPEIWQNLLEKYNETQKK